MANNKDKAHKPTTIKAVLDERGVLVRYEAADHPEGIDVPAECDIKPGEYAWDGEKFVPLPKSKVEINSEVAVEIHDVISQLVDAGLVVASPRLEKWLKGGK